MLSQWEVEFPGSMRERVRKWGSRVFVSEKAMEVNR
jgi:hypothetical protein